MNINVRRKLCVASSDTYTRITACTSSPPLNRNLTICRSFSCNILQKSSTGTAFYSTGTLPRVSLKPLGTPISFLGRPSRAKICQPPYEWDPAPALRRLSSRKTSEFEQKIWDRRKPLRPRLEGRMQFSRSVERLGDSSEQTPKNTDTLKDTNPESRNASDARHPDDHSPLRWNRSKRIASGHPQKHLIDRLPKMPQIHRPSKEELLAAATGFWSRLKVRFKWFSIRSARPFNVDEISAFFSWVLVGHVLWIVLGTTTFFSLAILAVNTVFAQGK